MRRWLAFILSLLLLGALTTIGVAWSYAGFAHPLGVDNRWSPWTINLRSQGQGWAVTEWIGPGKHFRVLMTLDQHLWHTGQDPFDLPSWSQGRVPADATQPRTVIEDSRGWPWPALRCTWHPEDETYTDVRSRLHGGIIVRPFNPDWLYENPTLRTSNWVDAQLFVETHTALPFIPIPGAFARSTLLYAGVWGGLIILLSLPRFVFAHLRRIRQRCSICGYQVHATTSSLCSECGTPTRGWIPIVTSTHVRCVAVLLVLMTTFVSVFATTLRVRFAPPPAIHLAARADDVATIETLLASGTDVDTRYHTHDLLYQRQAESTPLMWAAAHGSIDAMAALIEAGADINAVDAHGAGNTALGVAARAGQRDAMLWLLENDADPRLNLSLLQDAVISGDLEILRLALAALEDNDADLVKWRSAAVIMAAAHAASLSMVDELLAAGVDDEGLSSAMAIAISSDADALVDRLLDASDIASEATLNRWLRAAVEEQKPSIVRLLVQRGADPNHATIYRSTLMHDAVRSGNLEIVRILIELGGDPHIVDGRGETLLYAVWWFQDLTILHELLALGIDVNRQNNRGMTVLHEPVHFRRIQGVRPLLDAGADPMIPDHNGVTALDRARAVVLWGTREPPPPDPEIVALLEHAAQR